MGNRANAAAITTAEQSLKFMAILLETEPSCFNADGRPIRTLKHVGQQPDSTGDTHFIY
jgi:hypothetical protein